MKKDINVEIRKIKHSTGKWSNLEFPHKIAKSKKHYSRKQKHKGQNYD